MTHRRGFTRAEGIATVAATAVAGSILIGAASGTRQAMSLGESMGNLKRLADSTAAYGADNADLVATFSWKEGTTPSSYPDLQFAASDLEAAANQAVDIIRRRSNVPNFAKIQNWVPHVRHSYSVLADYLDTKLPMPFVASPEDGQLLTWSSDPANWQQTGAPHARAPFWSTYELPVAFWSENSGPRAVYQSGVHSSFLVPGDATFGGRRLTEIVHPSHKAMWFDQYQRHFGPRIGYFMYAESRIPLAAADGSVSVRQGDTLNLGWQPQSPTNQSATFVTYEPASYEPPKLEGVSNGVPCRIRFTRQGLFGRDFDGKEVP